MDNNSVAIFLLGVQAVLLIVLLIVMGALLNRISATSEKINALMGHVDRLVSEEVRPTLSEARKAIQHIDALAEGAVGALKATEPVVRAVGQVATIFQKPSTPLWLDALRLAVGVFGVIRSKRTDEVEHHSELPAHSEAGED